ncbi:3009_t:CDS:2 [Ambispora leptoticha]|uniref:3009_t:CDS:1 n=1 Tax=Ambispora leptoticha TaxID=144679 RepID=A0A9N9AM27_9GLOM|nr:3009_t:CDS:2 [Ambispora leptoticha]
MENGSGFYSFQQDINDGPLCIGNDPIMGRFSQFKMEKNRHKWVVRGTSS